ncbi:hypothetical protein SHIRM173S_08332 [Streptomyces hirsutus]
MRGALLACDLWLVPLVDVLCHTPDNPFAEELAQYNEVLAGAGLQPPRPRPVPRCTARVLRRTDCRGCGATRRRAVPATGHRPRGSSHSASTTSYVRYPYGGQGRVSAGHEGGSPRADPLPIRTQTTRGPDPGLPLAPAPAHPRGAVRRGPGSGRCTTRRPRGRMRCHGAPARRPDRCVRTSRAAPASGRRRRCWTTQTQVWTRIRCREAVRWGLPNRATSSRQKRRVADQYGEFAGEGRTLGLLPAPPDSGERGGDPRFLQQARRRPWASAGRGTSRRSPARGPDYAAESRRSTRCAGKPRALVRGVESLRRQVDQRLPLGVAETPYWSAISFTVNSCPAPSARTAPLGRRASASLRPAACWRGRRGCR